MPSAAPTQEQVPMSTLLAGLGREATARVRRAMRPLGLGAQQFVVMKQLQALGQTSQAELADALAIDRSNLAAIAADLAARELVERTRHEVDRRRCVLRLSRAGEQLLYEAGQFSMPVEQAFPLDQALEAQRISQAGHVRGKLVLIVD